VRSLYKGTLGFGLVSIPVQVYKALDSDQVTMHWVHRTCGSRIRYQKVCPVCQAAVEQADLVKATPLEDGRLVWLEDDESAGPAMYFNQAYWLKPGDGGAKAYRLLWEAMEESEKVAVAQMKLRSRAQLAVIRPYHTGTLLLHSMHYPEALRSAGAHFGDVPVGEPSPKEREMALELVRQLAEPFRPEAYPNEQRAELLERIRAHAAAAVAEPEPPPNRAVVDLVAQLKASVEQARQERGAG
jgi:DNA end-binding protein Ku